LWRSRFASGRAAIGTCNSRYEMLIDMSSSRVDESVRGYRTGGHLGSATESAPSRPSARARLGALQKCRADRYVKGLGEVSERVRVLACVVASVLAIAAIVTFELVINGPHVRDWDLLFDSGCITVITGLWLSRGLSAHFVTMVERLTNRHAFTYPDGAVAPEEVSEIMDQLYADVGRSERILGMATGGLIALLFVVANTSSLPERSTLSDVVIWVVVAACIGGFGGFLVGRVIGRMLSYGSLGRRLTRRGISFRVIPGHVDGAAGLKPLGNYYLHQSLLVAIPVVFLLVWSLLFLTPALAAYESWRPWYLVLLTLTICLGWATFYAPLRSAHEAMRRQKRDSLFTADSMIAPQIVKGRGDLEQDLKPDRRSALRDRVDQLTISYREIERMPTWPLDRSMRRHITLGNIAVLVPLVIQVLTAAMKGLSS
jgi:hypothetical protein